MRPRIWTTSVIVALAGIIATQTISPAAIASVANVSEPSKAATRADSPSGLPIPRFVALKRDRVHARFGPSFDYPVAYEFTQRGRPLKVIAEDRDDNWRRVEDLDGQRMWIHVSMLESNQHAVISAEGAVLRAAPRPDAPGRARLTTGVMAKLESCEDNWCRIKADTFRGWIQREALWGAPLDRI